MLAYFSCFNFRKQMRDNPYVVAAWVPWLAGVGELHNVHILDLFYWEHWAGNFAAMTQAEWDIVQEVLTPFNCRQLLVNMLAVDERYRDHDKPILYRALVSKLWPEALSAPVNPPFPPTMRGRVRHWLKRARNLGRSINNRLTS